MSNFTERIKNIFKNFSFDSYMTLFPEFVEALLKKGPKVAELTTEDSSTDIGNGFSWNEEPGTLIIHANGSEFHFYPKYNVTDIEEKRVKTPSGKTRIREVPKSGAKPYEYFNFLLAYNGNPYRKLTEFFKSLRTGFLGGSSIDMKEYRDYQKVNGNKFKFINQYDPKYRKYAERDWERLSKLGWIQSYDH